MRVFTDGACSGNPGPGGWAWVTDDGRHDSGGEPDTTNQRMELTAVLRAVEALEGELDIFSDSTYVVNCFNERWYEGWRARGWKSAQRKPVANRDLWEPLIDRYLERRHELSFTWVKGHAGNELNEVADGLAVAALEHVRRRLPAEGIPIDRGEPGDGRPGPEPPWPAERAVAVTGAREPDEDQVAGLAAAIADLDPGNDIVVSGLRRGAELEGAEMASRAGIPVAVVLPYADPVRVWSPRDRDRFEAALRAADWLVTLDGDPDKPGAAIRGRNRWLWTAAVGAIVVGDHELAAEAELAGLGVIAL